MRSRNPKVFDILATWTCPLGYAPDGILSGGSDWPVLLPEMAIADALVDRHIGGMTHMYDPDDLDPEEMGEGAPELFMKALTTLGQDPDEVPFVGDYLRTLAGADETCRM
ncbi:hypothetical protein KUV57_12000 [Epibacterium sp. DP7N7-1]|nr:hypothetical protein [Epibacterium sp. DP7N7-1]